LLRIEEELGPAARFLGLKALNYHAASWRRKQPVRSSVISFAQELAIGVFIVFGVWSTGRAILHSVRERRGFSRRKNYSLGLDLTVLAGSSIVGVGAALCVMLPLDHFGLMTKPYIWLAGIPLLAAYFLGNRVRQGLERRLARGHREQR
jgi:hypothetical protein